MGVGRNLSYKENDFFRHKGFSAHNNIPSGDDDLFINTAATKKNTKINIDKNAFTLSEPQAPGAWVRQKTGITAQVNITNLIIRFLLGIYSFSHFLFYPLLVSIGPFLLEMALWFRSALARTGTCIFSGHEKIR